MVGVVLGLHRLFFVVLCKLFVKYAIIMYEKYRFMEKRGGLMKFSYNDLWKLLIDKNMKKKDLIDRTGISPTTVSKMTKGEAVSIAILGKICEDLGSDIGDLICLDKER